MEEVGRAAGREGVKVGEVTAVATEGEVMAVVKGAAGMAEVRVEVG
jgi:hypothetical protein